MFMLRCSRSHIVIYDMRALTARNIFNISYYVNILGGSLSPLAVGAVILSGNRCLGDVRRLPHVVGGMPAKPAGGNLGFRV